MLPDDHIPLICFFKQYQNADHTSDILDQLQKEKKEKKEKASKKSNTKSNDSSDHDQQITAHCCDGHRTCLYDCSKIIVATTYTLAVTDRIAMIAATTATMLTPRTHNGTGSQ
jgi:hypothetical protein